MNSEPVPVRRATIELRFVAILAGTVLAVSAVGFTLLYRISLRHSEVQLVELTRAQARLMESVAAFDAYFQGGGVERAPRTATLSQIKDAHRSFVGFGETGEIVLAERRADEIVFLLPSRKQGFRVPGPVHFGAERAGPMELALDGGSGVVTALDYTGEEVLAAYEWLPFLKMGLVCKMDVAEIRAPFLEAGLATGAFALLLVGLAVATHWRLVSPLLRDLLRFAAGMRDREERYRTLVGNVPGAVFRAEASEARTLLEVSEPIEQLTGHPPAALLGDAEVAFIDLVVPDDAEILKRALREHVQPGRSFGLEYRIRRSDGEIRWLSEQGTVAQCDGRACLEGVMLDITTRKQAERTLEELPRKLSRYLSPQVYRTIFEGERDVRVGSSRRKLTVFFSDIVGFTATSDELDPEDLSIIVNTYLTRMANIANDHGGTLDKFIGDGILVFFGDPETRGIQEDARACVRMALAMQEAVAELNQAILRQGVDRPIRIRIGISTGFCTVGNFGSDNRMDYTVLGRNVNLASRLESAAPPGAILIARETWLLVRDAFACEALEPIVVKGFEKPVGVFRVVGPTGSAPNQEGPAPSV
ncbi:MAG: adenylate/guanylate cyclase domain-containing protein [Myxococcota bacterium]|nr:adenylate/guanylate cyclase domain-containing protein [Myxococcota bacterium]